MLSFVFANKWLCFGVFCFLIILAMSWRISYLSDKNEELSASLYVTNEINKNLNETIKELNERHNEELRLIKEADKAKTQIWGAAKGAKEHVYKSSENNATKLFNDVTSKLWGKGSRN